MKFTIKVGDANGEWAESYDRPIGRTTCAWYGYHPDNDLRGRTEKAQEEWGQALVDWFNSGLRPHEKPRHFSGLIKNDPTL